MYGFRKFMGNELEASISTWMYFVEPSMLSVMETFDEVVSVVVVR
jgi:hypothetical protein